MIFGNGLTSDFGFNDFNMGMKHIQSLANTVVIKLGSGDGAKGFGEKSLSPRLDPVKGFGTHQPVEDQRFQNVAVRDARVPAASHRKVAIYGFGNLKPVQNRF